MPYLGPLLTERNLNQRRASLEHKNTLPEVGRWFPKYKVPEEERNEENGVLRDPRQRIPVLCP